MAVRITGNIYGRLTVLYKTKARNKSSSFWVCLCACGKKAVVAYAHLKNGHTRSCGCLYREVIKSGTTKTHGLSKTRTYKTWKEMRRRCNNPRNHNYKWYGGRGIAVDTSWDTFEQFYADMGDRPLGKTIDRIDVNLGYSKNNCRWATPKEQANNKQWKK